MQSKQRDPEINISNLKLTKYTFAKKFRQKSKAPFAKVIAWIRCSTSSSSTNQFTLTTTIIVQAMT